MSPHYLRFARALALMSGLGACTTAATEPAGSGASNGSSANQSSGDEHVTPADTQVATGGGSDLNGCSCYGSPITPAECPGATTCSVCCESREPEIMVGPLAPPDLPA